MSDFTTQVARATFRQGSVGVSGTMVENVNRRTGRISFRHFVADDGRVLTDDFDGKWIYLSEDEQVPVEVAGEPEMQFARGCFEIV